MLTISGEQEIGSIFRPGIFKEKNLDKYTQGIVKRNIFLVGKVLWALNS
jgi:hypothetical protein